jgi:hypothetical protein
MRTLLAFLCLTLGGLWSTDGLGQRAITLWVHNGSQVTLSANGPSRQFRYATPAADLLDAGVQAGTVLFDGRRIRKQYSGTAYVFSSSCGGTPYAVAGPVSAHRRTVTMYGKAPIVDSTCRIVGYRNDVLVFNLSSTIQASSNQGAATQGYAQKFSQSASTQRPRDNEYETYLEDWNTCFNNPEPTDTATSACTLALTYSRISQDDRTRLIEQRDTLAGPQRVALRQPIDARNTGENGTTVGSRAPTVPAFRVDPLIFLKLVVLIGFLVLLAVSGGLKFFTRKRVVRKVQDQLLPFREYLRSKGAT